MKNNLRMKVNEFLINRQEGQLTVFFATTLFLFLACMAFIINIGIFVKAKINLQNAVDAAAFAGAAVQARQLTEIGYMNWELRNNYKEWIFKNYVMGQISNNKTRPQNIKGPIVDFRLDKFEQSEEAGDWFNLPSGCLHFAQARFNLCSLYTVPGLPRFSPLGIIGIDETQNEFMNVFVKEKSKDCSARADMNFKMVLSWAYGTEKFNTPLNLPQVAAERVGFWPKAFEMALRIRNMEKIVNEPPKEQLCYNGGGCNSISNFYQRQGQQIPVHERTVKAFLSAYRNLGNNNPQEGLKSSFKMDELSPRPVSVNSENSMSGLFIPDNVQKYYLDLRVQLVNFVSFFSLFSTGSGKRLGTESEGECSSMKVGMPVPGSPFAFEKNPEVITYYAVKGEVEYTGLFNPFGRSAKLIAYAAAKPFGGRIGPMLLKVSKEAPLSINPRASNGTTARSYSYLSGLNASTGYNPKNVTPQTTFAIGYPLPLKANFWVSDSSNTIGGKGSNIKFAIPNIIYETNDRTDMNNQAGTDSIINIITGSNDTARPKENPAGLYDTEQYKLLQGNLYLEQDNSVNGRLIGEALARLRSPTQYEAMNYLIPHARDQDENYISHLPYIPSTYNGRSIRYEILAPLYGPDTYFTSIDKIQRVFENYISINKPSIDTYTETLKFVARDILGQSKRLDSDVSDKSNYTDAAKQIHDNPTGGTYDLSCTSLAGKFASFFLGKSLSGASLQNCNLSLEISFFDYLNRKSNETQGRFNTYFRGEYYPPLNRLQVPLLPQGMRAIMTAYSPGRDYGLETTGSIPYLLSRFIAPATPREMYPERNYYSTKFISLRSLRSGDEQSYVGGTGILTSYSEGGVASPSDISTTQFLNALMESEIFRVKE